MDWIIEKISQMDVGQLIATAGLIWYMMRPIKQEIACIKTEMAGIKTDIVGIKTKLDDINTRLSRVEGILMNKECCMIRDSRKFDKAE